MTAPSGYLQEHMRYYREDLRLIPNALDLSQYHYRERNSWKPRLLWLRGFLDYYNPELGVRVVAELAQEFPELDRFVFTNDEYKEMTNYRLTSFERF